MFNEKNTPIILTDDRFNRCYLVVMYPIECNDEAIKNVLKLMAFRKSKKYDTDKKIYEINVNNYTLSYRGKFTNIGKNSFFELYISFPCEQSIGIDILPDNLEFIKELIYNPLLKDGAFEKKEIENIIDVLKADIYKKNRNADFYYSFINDKIIDEDNYLYDPVIENPSLLDNVTPEIVYNLYNNIISGCPLIFLAGNVDANRAKKQIEKIFYDNKKYDVVFEKKYDYYAKRIVDCPNVVRENTNFKSSHISYNYKVKDISDYHDIALLGIVKCLLNSTKSRVVFDTLRTERGLVYKCGAYYYKSFGTLTIWASTGRRNIDKCDESIDYIMKKISNIDFIKEKLPLIKEQAKDTDLLNSEDIYNILMEKIDYYIGVLECTFYDAVKDITPEMVQNFINNRLVLVSKYIGVGTDE